MDTILLSLIHIYIPGYKDGGKQPDGGADAPGCIGAEAALPPGDAVYGNCGERNDVREEAAQVLSLIHI